MPQWVPSTARELISMALLSPKSASFSCCFVCHSAVSAAAAMLMQSGVLATAAGQANAISAASCWLPAGCCFVVLLLLLLQELVDVRASISIRKIQQRRWCISGMLLSAVQ